jgi:hypothetical protein
MSYWDDRMTEIAAQRRAEQASLQERELAELQEGTDAINDGLRNPKLWAGVVGGIAAAPFTGGASLGVSVAAGIKMNGGPGHMVKSALPMSVDLVAPKAGCIRIVSSLICLVLAIAAIAFVAALVAFEGGLIG